MTEEPRRPRALIVEDEESDRTALLQLVESQGFETATARTGRQAVACLDSDSFDLIVLDVLLPGMDGFEVMRAMRDRKPEIIEKTIVVSRLANSDLKVFFPAVAGVFTKPVDRDAFLAAVRRFGGGASGAATDSPMA